MSNLEHPHTPPQTIIRHNKLPASQNSWQDAGMLICVSFRNVILSFWEKHLNTLYIKWESPASFKEDAAREVRISFGNFVTRRELNKKLVPVVFTQIISLLHNFSEFDAELLYSN